MGTIKSTKDQSLILGVFNESQGKNKAKDSKQENPKYTNGGSNPIKDKGNKKEKKKCTYCHKGRHPESACMKKIIDMMAQHLEKKNIPLPEGTRKKEGGSSS